MMCLSARPIAALAIAGALCVLSLPANAATDAQKAAKYGGCVNDPAAVKAINDYDPSPTATLDELIAFKHKLQNSVNALMSNALAAKSDAAYYAKNRAAIDREIAALNARSAESATFVSLLQACKAKAPG